MARTCYACSDRRQGIHIALVSRAGWTKTMDVVSVVTRDHDPEANVCLAVADRLVMDCQPLVDAFWPVA